MKAMTKHMTYFLLIYIMASQVNRYRYYCQTESNYVYKWDTSKPTVCVNNISHTVDSDSVTIIDTITNNDVIAKNLPVNFFDEVDVAERSTIFDLKSIFGKSAFRDFFNVSGTAAISNTLGDAEYAMYATGANDLASMVSIERGKYIAGLIGEVGMGIRIPQTLTGNQYVRFGLYDNSNGFYFQYTKDGMGVGRRRDGIDSIVTQSNLNLDKLDGTGPSGFILNPTHGYIYNIQFSWYGYGVIEYHMHIPTIGNGPQTEIAIHRQHVNGETSVKTPHLPIRVDVNNAGTAGSNIAFVSGRSYAIIGKYTPVYRPLATFVANITVSSSSTFTPVLSIRRKTNYLGIPIRITGADVVCSTPQWIMVKTGATLTGSVWGTMAHQVNSETALEQDTTATAMTGGITLWMTYVEKALTSIDLSNVFDMQDTLPVTISAMNATNESGTVSVALRWTEEW